MDIIENSKLAVFAEAEDSDKPLILHDLSFGRFVDDVLIPFEKDEPFFIDGVSLTKSKVRRLKVLLQGPYFKKLFFDLHYLMRRGAQSNKNCLLSSIVFV